MKRPFDEIIDVVSSNLDQAVENDQKSQEFLHQFSIWIIGFSIGALYLIVSNLAGFKDVLTYWVIKAEVVFLTISICFGILHRLYLFVYQAEYNSNIFYIKGALSDKNIMEVNPTDVSEETNIETLVNLLKYDFDIDESQVLQIPIQNDVDRGILINYLRKKYTDIGAWAAKDYEIGMNHVNGVMKDAFGLNDKEIKRYSEVSGNRIRSYRFKSSIMLTISYSAFIISLIILAIAY